jgi:P27 family predicted phage terminase small subunit
MKKSDAPPSHLTAEARRLWNRLRTDYTLDDAAGLLLLQSVCEAYDRLREARRILAAEGCVVRDRWNQSKPHPATAVERDAANRMHSALRLLKLEPGAVEA